MVALTIYVCPWVNSKSNNALNLTFAEQVFFFCRCSEKYDMYNRIFDEFDLNYLRGGNAKSSFLEVTVPRHSSLNS